jgi:hypothetical protein
MECLPWIIAIWISTLNPEPQTIEPRLYFIDMTFEKQYEDVTNFRGHTADTYRKYVKETN